MNQLLLTSVSQDIRKAEASSSSGCVRKPGWDKNIGAFFSFFFSQMEGFQGSLNYLFGRDQTIQMYGEFGGFPL